MANLTKVKRALAARQRRLEKKRAKHRNPPVKELSTDDKVKACIDVSILVGPEQEPEYHEVITECMELVPKIANYDYLEVMLPYDWDVIKKIERDTLRQEWDWKIPNFKLTDNAFGGFANRTMRTNANKMWNTFKSHHDSKLGFDRRGRPKTSRICSCEQWNTPWSHGANFKKAIWILNADLNKEEANELAEELMEEHVLEVGDEKTYLQEYIAEKRYDEGISLLKVIKGNLNDEKWYKGTSEDEEENEDVVDSLIFTVLQNLGMKQLPKNPRRRFQRLVKWYSELPVEQVETRTELSFIPQLVMPETSYEKVARLRKESKLKKPGTKKAAPTQTVTPEATPAETAATATATTADGSQGSPAKSSESAATTPATTTQTANGNKDPAQSPESGSPSPTPATTPAAGDGTKVPEKSPESAGTTPPNTGTAVPVTPDATNDDNTTKGVATTPTANDTPTPGVAPAAKMPPSAEDTSEKKNDKESTTGNATGEKSSANDTSTETKKPEAKKTTPGNKKSEPKKNPPREAKKKAPSTGEKSSESTSEKSKGKKAASKAGTRGSGIMMPRNHAEFMETWWVLKDTIDLTQESKEASNKRRKLRETITKSTEAEATPAARGLKLYANVSAEAKDASPTSFQKMSDDWKRASVYKLNLIQAFVTDLELTYNVTTENVRKTKVDYRFKLAETAAKKSGFIADERISGRAWLDLCSDQFLPKVLDKSNFIFLMVNLELMLGPGTLGDKIQMNCRLAELAIDEGNYTPQDKKVLTKLLLAITKQSGPAYH